MNKLQKRKPIKSISLEPSEIKAIQKHFKSYPTKVEAAMLMGLDSTVLDRVARMGSGSEVSVNKIRNYFKSIS